MPISEAELASLSQSHDIITIGMRADEVRRARHGTKTTFLRVAEVTVELSGPIECAHGREVRIVGTPASRAAAVARVREVRAGVGDVAVSGFSLSDLEVLSARESVTLRALLEEL